MMVGYVIWSLGLGRAEQVVMRLAQVVRLVREAGFTCGCSERIGANPPGEDLFRLRRTEISGFDTIEDFEKKLASAYDWLHVAVQVVQR